MFKKVIKNKKGFGLIEVSISIYIIAMGLLGVVSLINQNLQVQYINKNKLIASQLAGEGIELVRQVRDNNWRNNSQPGWKTDIVGGNGGAASQEFAIDYRGRDEMIQVDGLDDVDARLYLNASGYYDHDSAGVPTLFYRTIEKVSNSDDSIEIKCKIKWHEREREHTYEVSTKLYDWKFAS